jgi:hypothetical protein
LATARERAGVRVCLAFIERRNPHPDPLPEYREREETTN